MDKQKLIKAYKRVEDDIIRLWHSQTELSRAASVFYGKNVDAEICAGGEKVMATIKSCSDLQQSKVLSKILPLKSADMYWWSSGKRYYIEAMDDGDFNEEEGHVRAWSLASLLGVLPEYNLQRTDWGNKIEYKIVVTIGEDNYASKNYDNPVDACYELILKLRELKML